METGRALQTHGGDDKKNPTEEMSARVEWPGLSTRTTSRQVIMSLRVHQIEHSVHDVRHTGRHSAHSLPFIWRKNKNGKGVREIRSQRDVTMRRQRLLDSLALLLPGRHQEHWERKNNKSIPSASCEDRLPLSAAKEPHTGKKKQLSL